MNRRLALRQLAVLAAVPALPSLAFAQRAGEQAFVTLAERIPTDAPGRIEVIEFFHYGCPHCRDFDPLLSQWLRKLPADVAFRRVPAIWGNPQLRALANLYYAIELAGQTEALHEKVFDAVQKDKRPMHTEQGVRDWLAKVGADPKPVMDNYKAFSTQSAVQRADQIARAYKVQGVPTMAVDGRYMTSASMTGSHEATLKVVDQLLARARAEQKRG